MMAQASGYARSGFLLASLNGGLLQHNKPPIYAQLSW